MCGGPSASESRVEIAVAVVEHQGRFLIGKRPDDAALGGYWEFPGGKVEQGESPADAAIRECLEETGVASSTTIMRTARYSFISLPARRMAT
jgi:mutator protein MutT